MARFRAKRGLSCQQVADALEDKDFKIDPATVYRIEKGDQTPKRETARRLYKFYRDQNVRIPLGAIYDPTFELEQSDGG